VVGIVNGIKQLKTTQRYVSALKRTRRLIMRMEDAGLTDEQKRLFGEDFTAVRDCLIGLRFLQGVGTWEKKAEGE
jgi:hypothetical protein